MRTLKTNRQKACTAKSWLYLKVFPEIPGGPDSILLKAVYRD